MEQEDLVTLEINTFDSLYRVNGSQQVTLSREQIEDIVSHAIQVLLMGWDNDLDPDVMCELEDALEAPGLLDGYE